MYHGLLEACKPSSVYSLILMRACVCGKSTCRTSRKIMRFGNIEAEENVKEQTVCQVQYVVTRPHLFTLNWPLRAMPPTSARYRYQLRGFGHDIRRQKNMSVNAFTRSVGCAGNKDKGWKSEFLDEGESPCSYSKSQVMR